MGMTITEKILAIHAGLEKVEPGDLIQVKIGIEPIQRVEIALVLDNSFDDYPSRRIWISG